MPKKISMMTEEEYDESIRQKIIKNIKVNENGCWIWQKPIQPTGYGKTTYKLKSVDCHRVSWIVFKGKIQKGKIICHFCDIRSCCNPSHLWVGTHKENTRDMMNKKKVFDFKGEKNNQAILKEKDIIEIRKLLSLGIKQCVIANMFNIDPSNISNIKNGKLWKHV